MPVRFYVSMPSIKVLPEFLINQIAAGEVVERPASIVKELIENSIDAGAKRITVEVEGGGDEFLRITDDGHGMDAEDAVLALERHATSKIASTDDLFNIHTLGFRGEAIASIASVSYFTLQTKKTGALEGTLVMCEGGKIIKVKPVGVPEGTQIEIRQLFYNTPARKKYLKNPTTEFQHIVDMVIGVALAFHDVGFRLIHDGKVVFDLAPDADDFTRVRALLGKTIADELIPIFYGHSKIQLKGFIGKPLIARSNRNLQYLFVNHREVKSHVLSYAVKQSYHSLLPKEKFPVFLLYFELDPELVDVNVHPRKQEVRFKDEKEIFSIIAQACKKSLETHVLAPKIVSGDQLNYYHDRQQQSLELKDSGDSYNGGNQSNSTEDVKDFARSLLQNSGSVSEALTFTKELSGSMQNNGAGLGSAGFESGSNLGSNSATETANSPTAVLENATSLAYELSSQIRNQAEEIMPLAQLHNSYILCQQNGALVVVDQHAAHERIRYTELKLQLGKEVQATQSLLTPFQMELSYSEKEKLLMNLDLLKKLGFEIESFGGNTFSIHAVPAEMAKLDLQKVFHGLLDELSKDNGKASLESLRERSLTYLACRSAVKFGDPLGMQEQVALIKKLMTLELPYTCPHGRPTMVTMSLEELKKRFGREY